jgi:alkylhydroperoxidase family enzyme
MTATFSQIKDPDENIGVVINWAAPLGADTISSSTWVIESGITLDSDTNTTTTATAILTGGVRGNTYNCTNRVTTAAGRIWDRTVRVFVEMQ